MLISPLRIFTAFVVAVVGVSAQDTCILGCLQQSLSPSTCSSYTDLTCVCTNVAFQNVVTDCLKANCTTADQESALELQQAECGTSSNTSSSSGSGTGTTSPTSSASGSSAASPASTSTKSNGAVHEQVPFLNGAFAFATIALGGALFL